MKKIITLILILLALTTTTFAGYTLDEKIAICYDQHEENIEGLAICIARARLEEE